MSRKRRTNKYILHSLLCGVLSVSGPIGNGVFAQDTQFRIDTSSLKILHILHLRNGDKLSGRIIAETEKEVTLLNSAVGQVVVSKSQITMREERDLDAPQLGVSTSRSPAQTNRVVTTPTTVTNVPAAVATVTNAPAAVAQSTNAPAGQGTNATAVAAAPAKPTPKPAPKPAETKEKGPKLWTTDVQLGLNMRWGRRDSEDFFSTVRSTYGKEKIKHTFDASFAYGTTEDVVSANKLTTSSKLEYNYSKRWYVYNLAGAGYDEVRKIDFQYEFGPGTGFQILERTNFVLKAEAGLTYTDQDRTDDRTETTYSARFATIYSWKIWDKLTTDGRMEIFPSIEEIGSYRMRLESTFRYPLWKNISLNVNFIDIYESDPSPGVPNNDLQVRSAIGIRF